jgi:single-stranded-DNA-specific exonuclease
MSEEALSKVVEGASAQVIDLPDGHQGVSGIVAARVLGKLEKVPVFVIAGAHGSARAPDGFNVRDALEACSSVLLRYGGHAAAGGFSVQEGKIDEFRRLMCEYCKTFQSVESASSKEKGPDIWLSLSDVTINLAEEVLKLEPFGEANEEPVFGIKGVTFSSVRPLGSDGRHLMLSLGDSRLKGIFWNRGDLAEPLRRASAKKHDILFCLNVSDFGERHVELRVVSIK